jgi:iron(III) transport system ATP-binding protein
MAVMTAVCAQGVSLQLGSRRVLDEVSISVEPGQVLALLGPSGAGKSTLLRVLLGLARPDSGKVFVRGELASDGPRIHLPPAERRLAVVFQELALWPHLTVAGNLEFVLRMQGWRNTARRERARALLEQVGLWSKASRLPQELSGGERQRVAMARALVASPSAVLFDEPLSHLDVRLKRELLQLLGTLLAACQTAAVYITHDPREAEQVAHAVAVVEEGRAVHHGTFQELRERPSTAFCALLAEELRGSARREVGHI